MFRSMKNSGKVLSRANDAAKGSRGRIEFNLSRNPEGDITLSFKDIGNYGKNRWDAYIKVSPEDVQSIVDSLNSFVSNNSNESLQTFEDPNPKTTQALELVDQPSSDQTVPANDMKNDSISSSSVQDDVLPELLVTESIGTPVYQVEDVKQAS